MLDMAWTSAPVPVPHGLNGVAFWFVTTIGGDVATRAIDQIVEHAAFAGRHGRSRPADGRRAE